MIAPNCSRVPHERQTSNHASQVRRVAVMPSSTTNELPAVPHQPPSCQERGSESDVEAYPCEPPRSPAGRVGQGNRQDDDPGEEHKRASEGCHENRSTSRRWPIWDGRPLDQLVEQASNLGPFSSAPRRRQPVRGRPSHHCRTSAPHHSADVPVGTLISGAVCRVIRCSRVRPRWTRWRRRWPG